MRVLFDANFFISALLPSQTPNRAIDVMFQAALDRRFALLAPDAVLGEVERKIAAKPYLAARIANERFQRIAVLLMGIREPLPSRSGPFPRVVRDPDDDYLLAYAAIGRADFLVSGDNHLHEIDDTTLPFDIIAPAAFLVLLRERGLLADD